MIDVEFYCIVGNICVLWEILLSSGKFLCVVLFQACRQQEFLRNALRQEMTCFKKIKIISEHYYIIASNNLIMFYGVGEPQSFMGDLIIYITPVTLIVV